MSVTNNNAQEVEVDNRGAFSTVEAALQACLSYYPTLPQ